MNSLIGLGALTSFAAGLASPLAPGVAFDTSFLEEPVMLLAFVLLGRTLEARARLKASGEGAPFHYLFCPSTTVGLAYPVSLSHDVICSIVAAVVF